MPRLGSAPRALPSASTESLAGGDAPTRRFLPGEARQAARQQWEQAPHFAARARIGRPRSPSPASTERSRRRWIPRRRERRAARHRGIGEGFGWASPLSLSPPSLSRGAAPQTLSRCPVLLELSRRPTPVMRPTWGPAAAPRGAYVVGTKYFCVNAISPTPSGPHRFQLAFVSVRHVARLVI